MNKQSTEYKKLGEAIRKKVKKEIITDNRNYPESRADSNLSRWKSHRSRRIYLFSPFEQTRERNTTSRSTKKNPKDLGCCWTFKIYLKEFLNTNKSII